MLLGYDDGTPKLIQSQPDLAHIELVVADK